MSNSSMTAGSWCHVEIPATDPETAKKFYSSLFGWKFTDVPEMGYILYETPGGVGGGMMKATEQTPPHLVNYILVDDMDVKSAEILAAGGTLVMPKMEIPNAGWMAWFKDPSGNVFGIWKSVQ